MVYMVIIKLNFNVLLSSILGKEIAHNDDNDNQISITLLNEKGNEIEKVSQILNNNKEETEGERTEIENATQYLNNEDEVENNESEIDEIENENDSSINKINTESQPIDAKNNNQITSSGGLYDSYRKKHDNKYILYDSDDEEDKRIMENILNSEIYEKIKNCIL